MPHTPHIYSAYNTSALAHPALIFAGNPLDRADPERDTPELWARHTARGQLRVLLLVGGLLACTKTEEAPAPQAIWLQGHQLTALQKSAPTLFTTHTGDITENAVFLGYHTPGTALPEPVVCTTSDTDTSKDTQAQAPNDNSQPLAYWCIALSSKRAMAQPHETGENWAEAALSTALATSITLKDLRSLSMHSHLPSHTLAVAAQAKSMLDWHARHRFCAACGQETQLTKTGYERRCTQCSAAHYPRTDPVVIMLAICGDKALIGRGPQIPAGVYTALAGFMEPGESMEEAVGRELFEEVGLKTERVTYFASQPWPWPSSLMLGCYAYVASEDMQINPKEIEDARWISRADAASALKGNYDVMLPPKFAIARHLIEHWVNTPTL